MSDFISDFLQDCSTVLGRLDHQAIAEVIKHLAALRARNGRLFLLGVGGSAANCSHAVNDFRKLAGIETYAPTDNVSELTARINDEGWAGVFAGWLQASRLRAGDAILIMSVGGGDRERNVSPNLVEAIDYAKTVGAAVLGIVGRDGGYTARQADACVVIPVVNSESITPLTEGFQAIVWHLMVSHPDIKNAPTKWESVAKAK